MSSDAHPMAPHHLPPFIPGADGSDGLFTIMVAFLLLAVFGLGILYLSLHSLPERMAHKTSNTQLQIITVLTLLALFTHQHLFWIAALLLAVVRLPDYSTPLQRIANALDPRGAPQGDATPPPPAAPAPPSAPEGAARREDG